MSDLDAIFDQLETAGLVEQYVDDDGKAAMRLTANGAQVARAMAMAGDADPAAVLDVLLDGERADSG